MNLVNDEGGLCAVTSSNSCSHIFQYGGPFCGQKCQSDSCAVTHKIICCCLCCTNKASSSPRIKFFIDSFDDYKEKKLENCRKIVWNRSENPCPTTRSTWTMWTRLWPTPIWTIHWPVSVPSKRPSLSYHLHQVIFFFLIRWCPLFLKVMFTICKLGLIK